MGNVVGGGETGRVMKAREETGRRLDWWLVAIVLLAASVGAILVSRARNWGLMTDELLYAEMARNIADSFVPLPQARGELIRVNQVLYPILIAPLLGSLSVPTAYPVIAAFNAVVMATAAIPVYLLTRYASGSRVAARWAAACAVSLPWLALASKVLPDALAYAAVLWALFAIARTAGGDGSRRETAIRDALTLLAIVAAYLARSQFIVLFGVWILAVVASRLSAALVEASRARDALGLSWRAAWRTVIERPVLVGSFGLLVFVVLVTPIWLLGIYTGTVGPSAPVATQGLGAAIVQHAGVMAVALLGLPFVFGLPWLVAAIGRPRDLAQHQTALTLIIASVVLLYVAATFNQRFGDERVLERYIFYIAPLVLVAAACFFVAPPRNAWFFAIPAAVGILLVNQTDPYGLSANVTLGVNHAFSPAQIGLVVLQKTGDVFGLSISWLLMLVGAASALVAWLLIQRDHSRAAMTFVFTLTLVGLIATSAYSVVKVVDHQNSVIDRLYGDRTTAEKAWVDAAVCAECTASMSFSPTIDVERMRKRDPSKLEVQKVYERISNWWDVEFWNSRFDTLYLDDPSQPPTFGAAQPISVGWQSGRLGLDKADKSTHLLVAERNPKFQPQPALGTEPEIRNGLALYRLTRPPMAAWATQGLTRLGWVPPEGATLRVYAPAAANASTEMRVSVDLASTKGPSGFRYFESKTDQLPRASFGNTGLRLTFRIDVPAGKYRDIPLGWRPIAVRNPRLRGNAHVQRISAVPRS